MAGIEQSSGGFSLKIPRNDWPSSVIGALLSPFRAPETPKCLPRRLFVRDGAFGGDGADAAKPKVILMTKRNTKRQTTSKAPKTTTGRKTARKVAVKASKPKSPRQAQASTHEQAEVTASGRTNSKQAKVIASLRAPSGATIDAMMKATGWQQHSVRGFLAGVVRKKLRLDLVSEAGKSGRIYRIIGDVPRLGVSAPTSPA